MSQSYTSGVKHGLGEKAEGIMDKAANTAQNVAEQGRHVAAKVQENAEDAYYATERTIRQNPMMTVVLGVALGFALGALWKAGSASPSWSNQLSRNYYEPAMRSWRNASWW